MCLVCCASLSSNHLDWNDIDAVTQALGCDTITDCVKGPADAVNLPIFLMFDTKKKEVITAKEGNKRRTSKILEVSEENELLAFVGFDPSGNRCATLEQDQR